MLTFSIKKSEQEGGEDIIVKSGHIHEFTASAVKANLVEIHKTLKEINAQLELETAKKENIKAHHEIVGSLTGQQICAIALYAQADATYERYAKKKQEVEEVLKDITDQLAQIKEQTGVEIALDMPNEQKTEPVEEKKEDSASPEASTV